MAKSQQISSLNITITGDATQLNNALNAATKNLNKFNVNVGGNATSQAGNNLNNLGNQAKKNQGFFDDNLRALGRYAQRLALIYGTYKAFDFASGFITDSVRLAAEAESAQVQFRVLLDDAKAAKQLLDDIVEFTEFTPFRLENTRQAARVLSAVGVTAERIMPTLRTLGDVAAGAGVPLLELAEVYAQTKEEGVVFTRDLRQFQRRAIPVTEQLAKQFGVAKEEVRNLASEGKISFQNLQIALAELAGETGRYKDITSELAKTTEGQFSNLLDEIDSLKREIGRGLLPVLTAGVVLSRELVQVWSEGDLRNDVRALTGDLLTFISYAGQGFNLLQEGVLNMARGLNIVAIQLAKVNDLLFDDDLTADLQAYNDELESQLDIQAEQRRGWADLLDKVDEYRNKSFDPPEGKTLADFIKEINEEIQRTIDSARQLKNELKDVGAIEKGSDDDLRARRRSLLQNLDTDFQPAVAGGVGGNAAVNAVVNDPSVFRDLEFTAPSEVPPAYLDTFSNIFEGLTADGLTGDDLRMALTQQMNDFFDMIGAQINDLGQTRDNEREANDDKNTAEITSAQNDTTNAVNELNRNLPRLIFAEVGI